MGRKKEELPDYTVADMDLEGMPWNSRRLWQILPGDPGHGKVFGGKGPGAAFRGNSVNAAEENRTADKEQEPVSREERRIRIGAALKASLMIWAVFAAGAFLFILFCVYVWLK